MNIGSKVRANGPAIMIRLELDEVVGFWDTARSGKEIELISAIKET
jgi:hypothetical protein